MINLSSSFPLSVILRFLFLPVIMALIIGMPSAADTPIEHFASLPTFQRAKLSPDGNSIVYGVPSSEGRLTVVHQNLDGSERGYFPPPKNAEIESFYWANNNVLLIKVGTLIKRSGYARERFNSRVWAYNIKEKKTRWLGKPKSRNTFADSDELPQRASQIEQIVDFLADDPDHILLGLNFDLDAQDEVFRVNVNSGKRKMIKSQRHSIYSWYTDNTAQIRLGIGYKNDRQFTIFRKEDGTWVDLDKTDWSDTFSFTGFTEDPNIIYATARTEEGTIGLFTIHVETGELIERKFTHPKYDIASVIKHPITGYVSGVSYIDDFYRIKYFDKDLARIKRGIDKALPSTNNYIAGRAKERRAYLIYSDSDTLPGAYYLFDRDKGELAAITTTYPDLDLSKAASTRAVTITARDGTEIPGYLTLPNGHEDPEGLPAIILPHGGPTARSTADWHYKAQFLADRGYVVMQPNFRGSEGYGVSFQRAGERQWGGLMQDDVTDATSWLINQGYADPARICIVGSSYGGYASLMGVIKEPTLYKCAASINGVADLPSMKARDDNFLGSEDWTDKIGLEGAKDRDVSPFHRAEEINVPTLIMASRNDRRVPYTQSEKMHKRLLKLKKETRYVEMQDGDHYMMTAASRFTVLEELEKFLSKHIGQ
jgi:dipeptidyl aminopeptidase/acylaminoacyl peptidase